jgi:glycosyltransferase involved in cell wall biosynthesis
LLLPSDRFAAGSPQRDSSHVSVVMAVYNSRDDVEAALASIQGQTCADWDLIVIDDGSTDGTRTVLERVAGRDRRVTLLRSNVNIGQAACLNLGWRQASGDLIARLDADDHSLPTRLERQASFMRAHPDIAVLGSAAVLIDEHGTRTGVAARPELHDDLVEVMYKEAPFFHPSVMIRRGFLEALGGYAPSLRRAHDLDLWLRGYRRFRYHNLREPLIEYRVRHRQSAKTILEGTYVLARSAWREGLLLRRGWYAPRYFAATLLAKLGLRNLRFG